MKPPTKRQRKFDIVVSIIMSIASDASMSQNELLHLANAAGADDQIISLADDAAWARRKYHFVVLT